MLQEKTDGKKEFGIISDTHGLLRPEVISILKTCDCIYMQEMLTGRKSLTSSGILAVFMSCVEIIDRDWAEKLFSYTSDFKIEGTEFFMTHNKKDVAWDLGTAQVVIFRTQSSLFLKK